MSRDADLMRGYGPEDYVDGDEEHGELLPEAADRSANLDALHAKDVNDPKERRMPTYEVRLKAEAEGTVEVEADDEEEALAKARDRGFDRDDYYELSGATPVGKARLA